jgi:hypothetical protein
MRHRQQVLPIALGVKAALPALPGPATFSVRPASATPMTLCRIIALLLLVPFTTQARDIDLPDVSLAAETTTAEVPVPKVGNFQTFVGRVGTVDCQRWEVTAADANGFLVSSCGKYTSYLSLAGSYNLNRMEGPDGQPLVVFEPYFPAVEFPLAVRKVWKSRYEGYLATEGLRWEGEVTCRVIEFAPVTVKAGTFDAFRIECYDHRRAAMLETGANSTMWYAPSVPAVVKTVNHEDPRWDSELADYGPR